MRFSGVKHGKKKTKSDKMVRRTFTETIDLNTEVGGPSLLGLHTPISGDAYRFLYPFFMAYKKYKYIGMDVTIVNSARLPYDPEQIGKVEGENYVDPRDSLNPVLFKGCHGESLGKVLDSMYEGLTSDIFKDNTIDKEVFMSTLENFYYTALGDDSWRKSPIQKTLRIKGLHPLVYQLASNRQIMPSNDMVSGEYVENAPYADATGLETSNLQPGYAAKGTNNSARPFNLTPNSVYDPTDGSTKYRVAQSMFTNKCTRLGWMDTLQIVGNKSNSLQFDKDQISLLPKLFMGLLMLPPAYLTRNYLRIIIQHKFAFSGYRTITTGGSFPGFDPNADHYGYANKITGNVPGTEGSNKTVLMGASVGGSEKADALGSETDAVDYDAIEEEDSDE